MARRWFMLHHEDTEDSEEWHGEGIENLETFLRETSRELRVSGVNLPVECSLEALRMESPGEGLVGGNAVVGDAGHQRARDGHDPARLEGGQGAVAGQLA